SGALYFTDPTYGLRDNAARQEQPVQGVYRLNPDGILSLIETSFTQPNGLAFSPDETLLYIGDSQNKVIRRFHVLPDGKLAGGELFVDLRGEERAGNPDGMKVDEDGRLWTTGAGGIWAIAPDGTCLGFLLFPEITANIAFGDSDFSTLYVTARTSVYRVETTVRGIAPGSR
ncbi:MAG: SMP-30/gluconolactonase/LRE family protein, partial [Chloroflexota bacterium]|nr:SMP-30/gluconolactonase/LRE family protein [Chloroflexota bacterium]